MTMAGGNWKVIPAFVNETIVHGKNVLNVFTVCNRTELS